MSPCGSFITLAEEERIFIARLTLWRARVSFSCITSPKRGRTDHKAPVAGQRCHIFKTSEGAR